MVVVRYTEFGNMEKVNKVELCHLPSNLSKIAPVAVRVRVGGVEGVKDNEKNRAKIEKKLDVDNLEVNLNREGFASFYANGKVINFKGGKSKDDAENNVEYTLVRNTPVQKMSDEDPYLVTKVVRGSLEVNVDEFKSE